MPKQKTHSGLKKRIKVTGSGKLMRGHAYTGHLKTNKKMLHYQSQHQYILQMRRELNH